MSKSVDRRKSGDFYDRPGIVVSGWWWTLVLLLPVLLFSFYLVEGGPRAGITALFSGLTFWLWACLDAVAILLMWAYEYPGRFYLYLDDSGDLRIRAADPRISGPVISLATNRLRRWFGGQRILIAGHTNWRMARIKMHAKVTIGGAGINEAMEFFSGCRVVLKDQYDEQLGELMVEEALWVIGHYKGVMDYRAQQALREVTLDIFGTGLEAIRLSKSGSLAHKLSWEILNRGAALTNVLGAKWSQAAREELALYMAAIDRKPAKDESTVLLTSPPDSPVKA